MPPENVIRRYIQARILSQRGSDGERAAAVAAMRRMEANHPNLVSSVRAYETTRARKAAQAAPPPPQPATPRAKPASDPDTSDPTDWFKLGQALFETASSMFGTATRALAGRQLATHVEANSKMTNSGAAVTTLRIPASVLRQVSNLDELQRYAFRSALHEMLDSELDELLEGEEED